MALVDALPFTAATGRLLTGAVGTTKPTYTQIAAYMNSNTPITGLTDIGHTELDSGFANDGTEATSETKGSYQNPQLKVVQTAAATEFVTVASLQVTDANILALYYGGGTAIDGEFAVPQTGSPAEKAMLLIRKDGTRYQAEWFSKVAIERNGPMVFPREDFASAPLKFTALVVTGQPAKTIISPDVVAP